MIFYLLHELMPSMEKNYGRRNCRIFILGVVLYCACFVILTNLTLYNYIKNIQYEGLYWTGIILLISDICVMAYEYKNFFGRNIMNEVHELGSDYNEKWIYDEVSHKYLKKSEYVIPEIMEEQKILNTLETSEISQNNKKNKKNKKDKKNKKNKKDKI